MNQTNIASTIEWQNNNIVPVLCDDVMEFTLPDSSKTNLRGFINNIFQSIISEEKDIQAAFSTDFFFGMSLMCDKRKSFKQTLYNVLRENAEIHLKETIKQYLLKSKTQIILTTFPTDIIEKELNNEVGFTKYESKYFCFNKRNDLPIIMKDRVVVYHLLGGQNIENWACDEDTMLTFLHAFHSDYTPTALLRHINSPEDKKLLVLGSTLPNWLFRFLLYPMYKSQGGFWLSEENIDAGLNNFLSRKEYEGLAGKNDKNEKFTYSYVFDNIYKNVAIQPKKERKKVFVSYKSEPKDSPLNRVIDNIVSILQNDYNVWYDKNEIRDKIDDPYWKSIKDAIKESNGVIFIATPRYLEEYKNAPKDLSSLCDLTESVENSANDPDEVTLLSPVVREAYYAIKMENIGGVIIPIDGNGSEQIQKIENLAKTCDDNINLPLRIFSEHNMEVHDDKNPKQFSLQI